MKRKFETKYLLYFYVALMLLSIVVSLIIPEQVTAWINNPALYKPFRFIHILSVTLFFANAVIGTLWETRGLLSNNSRVIKHTYDTVVWLDAILTAPLIVLAVFTGITLGTIIGGVWSIGWLSLAITLFLFSGFLWIVADIPTQYRLKKEMKKLDLSSKSIPKKIKKLLYLRMGISFLNTAPLLIVFYLMVFKPDIPNIGNWMHS